MFRDCEQLVLRTALAILLPFLLLGAALWWVLPARPSLSPAYLALAILAPGVNAIWYGLALIRRSGMVNAALGVLVAAGWYYGLARPLAVAEGPQWGVLAAQLALAVALRWIAAGRWRRLDWPRGAGRTADG